MSDLYDADILEWSKHQAALLRRLAAGERGVNDQVDWGNVIEEVESVGRSQLSTVRSHIIQAFLHDLKAEALPSARDVPHWRTEAKRHRIEAAEAYAPSMRQKIDIADLYAKALNLVPETMDAQAPPPMPVTCPVTLDEIIRRGQDGG